jgi:hypothetical protein
MRVFLRRVTDEQMVLELESYVFHSNMPLIPIPIQINPIYIRISSIVPVVVSLKVFPKTFECIFLLSHASHKIGSLHLP